MQRSIMLCVVLMMLSVDVGAAQAPPSCNNVVTAFLKLPDQRHEQHLYLADRQACWGVVAGNNAYFDRLLTLVSHGERRSAHYLAQHLAAEDGGNLEDALIALGEFADRDPDAFLQLLKQGALTAREAGDAAAVLALTLSDQPAAQLAALHARRQRISKVDAADLAAQKALVLRAIDGAIAEVRAQQP